MSSFVNASKNSGLHWGVAQRIMWAGVSSVAGTLNGSCCYYFELWVKLKPPQLCLKLMLPILFLWTYFWGKKMVFCGLVQFCIFSLHSKMKVQKDFLLCVVLLNVCDCRWLLPGWSTSHAFLSLHRMTLQPPARPLQLLKFILGLSDLRVFCEYICFYRSSFFSPFYNCLSSSGYWSV